ncbi:MAG: lysophospholipid acyltransferase family protein [Synechococcaceae cyanobacterium]|nr:lysophospholipid acyltransferase family protein [Synechococcaceae cyanobacterium]
MRRKPSERKPFKTISWHLEALGLRLLLLLLKGRSHRTMRRLLHRGVGLARPLLGGRIATAAANLERVYGGQLSQRQRLVLAERSLESFLLAGLESIIQPVPEAAITVEGEGLSELLRQPRQGQGVIVASLHLGCWDIALRWLSQRLPALAVVYRPANNPLTDPLLNRARSANSNCLWIPRSDSLAMARHLRRGGDLVLMTDLTANRRNGVVADFLGLQTRFTPGPMRFSQRLDTPLFPAAHVREDDGSFRLIFGAPIRPCGSVAEQATALARWQEPWIQAYTEQYYWINRRWRGEDGRRLRQLPAPAERVLALADS